LDRKNNPSALDAVRWQNYLMLMRLVEQRLCVFQIASVETLGEPAVDFGSE
jgi:hypothetical protein